MDLGTVMIIIFTSLFIGLICYICFSCLFSYFLIRYFPVEESKYMYTEV